jgi:hypothetical protein
MIKKKAKGKTTKKKAPTKTEKSAGKGASELNPAEVRKEIAEMVKSEAGLMAEAVIGEGKKGQLATVKYLWEVAKIFPEATDGSQASADEECLAATLLRRLDLPLEPVVRDEEDLPKTATSADKATAKPADEVDEKQSGTAAEGCEEDKEPVLA